MDEADIDIVGATSSTTKGGLKRSLPQSDSGGSSSPRPPPNKRKPGPIPKDVIVRRPSYSPINTPPSSPIPWLIEDAKIQPVTPIDTSLPPVLIGNLPNALPAHVGSVPSSSAPEKLMNGLAEMPTIPVFEPIPVEHINNHMDTPPVLTPIINNVDTTPKIDVKSERTDSVRNECNRLPVSNDSIENNVRVADNVVEEKLTNHVEERRKTKSEKEKKLTKKELEDIKRHNLNIRELVYKEVRRRGTSKSPTTEIRSYYHLISSLTNDDTYFSHYILYYVGGVHHAVNLPSFSDYNTLFSHLHQVQGSLYIRLAFVKDIVKESLRFKRRNLASLLEEYLNTLSTDDAIVRQNE